MVSIEQSELGNKFKVNTNEGNLIVLLLKNLFMIQKRKLYQVTFLNNDQLTK